MIRWGGIDPAQMMADLVDGFVPRDQGGAGPRADLLAPALEPWRAPPITAQHCRTHQELLVVLCRRGSRATSAGPPARVPARGVYGRERRGPVGEYLSSLPVSPTKEHGVNHELFHFSAKLVADVHRGPGGITIGYCVRPVSDRI